MSAPYSFLCFDVEDAIKAYIQAVDAPTGVTLYTTADACAAGEEIAEPYIAINCEDSGPVPEMSNVDYTAGISNQQVTVNLYIRTHGSDEDAAEIIASTTARDFHKLVAGKMLDLLYRTDLIATLNGYADEVEFVQADHPRTKTTTAQRSFVTTITFTAHAYPRTA